MDQPLTPPPLPVLPLEYAPPPLFKRDRFLIVTGLLSIVVLAIGTVGIYLEVETVLASGPALALIGVVMLIAGIVKQQQRLWMPGAGHLAICTLFVTLVNGLGWGPGQAARPFAVMATLYTVALSAVIIKLLLDERRRTI